MRVKGYAKSGWMVLVILLFLSSVSKAEVFEKNKWYYIIEPSVQMLSKPQKGADRVVNLEMGSRVQAVLIEADWVRIHEPGQGWIGWVSSYTLTETRPTFEAVWNAYLATDKDDKDSQRKWLERAVALDPINLDALDQLARVYEEYGNQAMASKIRQDAEFVRNSKIEMDSKNRKVIFLYQRNYIYPVAYTDGKTISQFYNSQSDLDSFITKYLRAGSRYSLFKDGTEVGAVTVMRNLLPGSIVINGCHAHVSAPVKSDIDTKTSEGDLLLASNGTLSPISGLSTAKISDAEVNKLKDVADKYFREKFANYNKDTIDEAIKNIKAEGFVVDYGSGRKETYSIFHFYALHAGDRSALKFSAFVFLAAKQDSTLIHKEASGGSGDAIAYMRKIIGTSDLDGDGNLDLITLTKDYESQAIELYIRQKNGLKHMVGNRSGC